ncbi:protein FAR1-RELATED SEQUENCE 4-like [Cucumis melo var. makuwa]|uniref:Protein FAR1-RELATED SEQUENCE 4-like n=1 Tax=Cucumis melo var. makuwa TaxID=1194695 RepID=A0A5A7VDN9_CUCMM|nr:protein FAR1-RELATED SEQUENCE 4-like [Cucumis melo var. makuwa]TYK24167.1 protein FAR1-RELATED SEQUENCE 4-like [Cucumis melo var. makuwa]
MVKILHGDTFESYALIPRFFDKLVESNPGTCTALEMDDSGHFKFFFMAFGASIEGWKYCRPVISVDGTFLKYSENDVSWTWFFGHGFFEKI